MSLNLLLSAVVCVLASQRSLFQSPVRVVNAETLPPLAPEFGGGEVPACSYARTGGDLARSSTARGNGRHSQLVIDETVMDAEDFSAVAVPPPYQLLVEGLDEHALLTLNASGLVTSWNRGAERLFGLKAKEILGHSFSRLFVRDEKERNLPETLMDETQPNSFREEEGWRVYANGERFWATVNRTPIRDKAGALKGFAVIVHDQSEKKKRVAAHEKTRRERARLQETFLSNVSHELRTPLTAIYFFISNVTDGLLGELLPDQQMHLLMALENVEQLKAMVADLLDITRVDTLKMTVEPRRVPVPHLVAEVLGTCQKNASAKQLLLRSHVAEDLPAAWADPHRVRQILTNLIDNATKFTEPGGSIEVAVRVCPEKSGLLEFSVKDSGCGISPEHREMVFDRLAQVKGSDEPSRGGLGLGLFIARDLVSQHGGRIWLESEPGQGSTFFFTLPIFSLAGRCAHILTGANLAGGAVTLIALDLVHDGDVGDGVLRQVAQALDRSIHATADVLLPWMRGINGPGMNAATNGHTGRVTNHLMTAFVVACTAKAGAAVIAARIGEELKPLSDLAGLEPVLSLKTIRVEPGELKEQIERLMERFEQLIQEHLAGKESLHE